MLESDILIGSDTDEQDHITRAAVPPCLVAAVYTTHLAIICPCAASAELTEPHLYISSVRSAMLEELLHRLLLSLW
jgi:hypothetical protein